MLQGVWRAAIHNPMRIYKVAYNLSATKQVSFAPLPLGSFSITHFFLTHSHSHITHVLVETSVHSQLFTARCAIKTQLFAPQDYK